MAPADLTHLEKRTLAYLNFSKEADEVQVGMVRDAIRDVNRLARPRFVYRYLKLQNDNEGHYYVDAPLNISYPSLQKLFKRSDSENLCVLVSTLGVAVDKRISALADTDSSRMLLIDAAANAMIEEETNAFQKRLGLIGETFRYAPGYGDVPLTMQREIFALMPEISGIGVELDEGNLMHPFKSMTGLIGFQ